MPDDADQAAAAGRSVPPPRLSSSAFLSVGMLLLLGSAFLLYTLVLEEDYMGPKAELLKDNAALIGSPAVVGLVFAMIAVKRSRQR